MTTDKSRILKIDNYSLKKGDIRFDEKIPHENHENENNINLIKTRILENTVKLLNLKRVELSNLGKPQWKEKIENAVRKSVNDPLIVTDRLKESQEIEEQIIKEVLYEIIGYGPIENFLNDDSVNEIMINGKNNIYIEKNGALLRTGKSFSSDDMIISLLDRILSPLGKRIDTSSPTVDARLKDGSRVHAVIPPLAVNGPTVTVRKFSKNALNISDIIKSGTLSKEVADFLKKSVHLRKNILVAGGTSSGKTTMLNVLSSDIKSSERIIIIEDSQELRLNQKHTIYLESRPPNIEGKGEVTIRDLLKNALRMRPDRIIIGECRGAEALDMLQAMNTGHEGCMTTLHANSPRDALTRLETMVLMAGFDLPVKAIREQVASAIDLIIHLARTPEGKRSVTSISEVCGTENSTITTQELYKLQKDNLTHEFKIQPTGNIPRFTGLLNQF